MWIAALLVGCGSEPLDGFVWNVDVTAATDECNDPPVDYAGPQSFEFRVVFDGSKVDLYLDQDSFATGQISGCEMTYDSVTWGEAHDGYDLKWQLHGDVNYRQGGDGCDPPLVSGVDWQGTETFTVVSTDDPSLPIGCSYTLDEEGVYVGPAS